MLSCAMFYLGAEGRAFFSISSIFDKNDKLLTFSGKYDKSWNEEAKILT